MGGREGKCLNGRTLSLRSTRELGLTFIESLAELSHDHVISSGDRERRTPPSFNVHGHYVHIRIRFILVKVGVEWPPVQGGTQRVVRVIGKRGARDTRDGDWTSLDLSLIHI